MPGRLRWVICLSALLASGCSLVSLGPALQSTSADYATVFEEYNNQGILRNILRARDQAPLSFADLPILHGSLSFNASLSNSTIGFGPLHGKGTTDTIGPGVSFTTNPTFDTNPLNTSGFSLLLLQPISPTFVYNAWQSGISKELLLRLLVESIEFTKCSKRVRIVNGVGDLSLLQQMQGVYGGSCQPQPQTGGASTTTTLNDLFKSAIGAGLDIRLLTIYLPLGPTFDSGGLKNLIDSTVAADAANLHVGNASGNKLQVYRSLVGQVVGCLNVNEFNKQADPNFKIADTVARQPSADRTRSRRGGAALRSEVSSDRRGFTSIDPPQVDGLSAVQQRVDLDLFGLHTGLAAQISRSTTSASSSATSGASKPSAGAGSLSSRTPGPLQQSDVQPGQISSILGDTACVANPLVLGRASETEASLNTEQGIVVHWRSIMGVFQYVGSVIEHQKSLTATQIARDDAWSWDRRGKREILFDLTDNPDLARVSTTYRGEAYGIPKANRENIRDHSLLVLSLLTRLLNDSRISGDIPTTQRLEVVP